jgi:hypothetical protein
MLKGRVGVRRRGSTRGHIPHFEKWVWGWPHLFRNYLEKAEFLAWEPKFFNKHKVKGVVKTTWPLLFFLLYCLCWKNLFSHRMIFKKKMLYHFIVVFNLTEMTFSVCHIHLFCIIYIMEILPLEFFVLE